MISAFKPSVRPGRHAPVQLMEPQTECTIANRAYRLRHLVDSQKCVKHAIRGLLQDCVAEGRLALMLGMYQKEGLGRERATVERRRRQAVGGTNKLRSAALATRQ